MNMSKLFDISKLKALAATAVASGKKNAPTLMTGGSIILGWVGVYIFWKQGKKAEKRIEYEEGKLNEVPDDGEEHEYQELPKIDKISIYLQYCWTALLCGLGSTGLAIGADRLNFSRLAEMALMVGFLNDKDGKQKALIEKLKAEVGDKKFLEMKDEVIEESVPRDEVMTEIQKIGPGSGKILFIDAVTHNKWSDDILHVTSGIAKFNSRLKEKRTKVLSERLGDAFYASDMPWTTDVDKASDVYSSLNVDVFLQCIGEIPADKSLNRCDVGDLLEFRYYGGGGDVVVPDQILSYKDYTDPDSGYPVVCYIDYGDLLSPTSELLDRNPI